MVSTLKLPRIIILLSESFHFLDLLENNWRLKASNLKKIVDCVVLYYSDELELTLNIDLLPEVMKIAEENDIIELGKLLKLILGLAVNCDEKQKYITQIMEMEEQVQQNIMRALQDIENIGAPSARDSLNLSNSSDKDNDRDQLAQKCHEKERQISIMVVEKNSMQQEIQKLQMMLERYENPAIIGDDAGSLGHPIQGSVRYNELRKQVDNLKNDLLLSETVKEDLKMKSSQQDKEVQVLQMKIDELTKATAELSQIKDEVDILREASERSKIQETQLSTLKKKLEDHNDVKRQLKQLEDRAAEYLKQNLQFEEESKKFSGVKGQVELYKRELEELHSKLDSEMQKTVKAEFDLNVMQTKIAGLQRERDNLMSQRDSLREKIDELRCNPDQINEEGSANISREMLGDNFKEKVQRLEAENKALREGQGGQTALSVSSEFIQLIHNLTMISPQDLLNDANQRNEKQREQLKTANQKILLLSSQSASDDPENKKIMDELKECMELCEQRGRLLEEAQSQLTNSHTRYRQMEATVESKNQELLAFEVKYRKCVDKAKEVIKGLDPRVIGGKFNKIFNESLTNLHLHTDHILLENPQDTNDASDRMSHLESRLISTAFYKLALNCQRDAVDTRLASISQGQSFMARQRQPAARKPLSMNFKK